MKNIFIPALFAIIMLNGIDVFSQSSTVAAILPKLNLAYKLPYQLSLNIQAETRHIYYENPGNTWKVIEFDRGEFAGFLSYKAGADIKFAIGYHGQISSKKWSNRLIQQASLVQRFETSRLGHRLAVEENFQSNNIESLRLRYRLVWERGLSGERIDPGEWYLKLSNEYLVLVNPEPSNLEIRLSPLFGYELNKKNKLEIGPDFRIDNVLQTSKKIQLFTIISWYTSL
jgi:hypothetical protein